MKYITIFIILWSLSYSIFAQDFHFTQFSDAPLQYNPAYTGVFYKPGKIDRKTDSRIILNYRNQWMNSQSSYITGYFQFDKKIGNQIDGIEQRLQNIFNLGLNLIYDQSLEGVYKTVIANGSLSCHLSLTDNSSLGIGFNSGYVNNMIDVNKISFSQQFTSGGFDLSLPNGEVKFMSAKPYFTMGCGMLFQSRWGGSGFANRIRIGISAFQLNKPKLTFYNNPQNIVPMRISFQTEFFHELGADSFFEIKILQQNQAKINYSMVSFQYSRSIGGSDYHDNTIGLGINYRLKDAISPSIYLAKSDYKLSYSYDINSSKLKTGLNPTNSMEFSLQYLINKNED